MKMGTAAPTDAIRGGRSALSDYTCVVLNKETDEEILAVGYSRWGSQLRTNNFQRLTALGFLPKTLGWSVHDWESLVILQYCNRCLWRTILVHVGSVLLLGTLYLIGYWKPGWWVKWTKTRYTQNSLRTPYFYHIFFEPKIKMHKKPHRQSST